MFSSFRIIKSIDATLQLSQTYQVNVLELGHITALFFFSIVVSLLDSTLDDWGLPVPFLDKASGVARSGDYLDMDIESKGHKNFKQSDHREQMRRTNSFLAMEVLGTITENRKAKVLLRLVHLNMYATPFLILFFFTSPPTLNLLFFFIYCDIPCQIGGKVPTMYTCFKVAKAQRRPYLYGWIQLVAFKYF